MLRRRRRRKNRKNKHMGSKEKLLRKTLNKHLVTYGVHQSSAGWGAPLGGLPLKEPLEQPMDGYKNRNLEDFICYYRYASRGIAASIWLSLLLLSLFFFLVFLLMLLILGASMWFCIYLKLTKIPHDPKFLNFPNSLKAPPCLYLVFQ